jgi:hypothetical protein
VKRTYTGYIGGSGMVAEPPCPNCERLETDIYSLAEWECTKQISAFSNHDWQYGFIRRDRLAVITYETGRATGIFLENLHDSVWLAAEEARIWRVKS